MALEGKRVGDKRLFNGNGPKAMRLLSEEVARRQQDRQIVIVVDKGSAYNAMDITDQVHIAVIKRLENKNGKNI